MFIAKLLPNLPAAADQRSKWCGEGDLNPYALARISI
jgi:hypothetical protein